MPLNIFVSKVKVLLLLPLLMSTFTSLEAQVLYYVTAEGDIDQNTVAAFLWSIDLQSLNQNFIGKIQYDHDDPYEHYITGLGFHPDGRLIGLAGRRIYTIDYSTAIASTISNNSWIHDQRRPAGGIAFTPNGLAYLGSHHLYNYDFDNNTISFINKLTGPFAGSPFGDLIYHNDSLIAVGGIIATINTITGEMINEIFSSMEIPKTFIGATKVNYGCDSTLFYLSTDEVPSRLFSLDLKNHAIVYVTDLMGGSAAGLISDSEFANPKIQLDLDRDDSGGILGGSWRNRILCEQQSYIVDADIKINACDSKIDAMTILFKSGLDSDYLEVPLPLPTGVTKTCQDQDSICFSIDPSMAGPSDIETFLRSILYVRNSATDASVQLDIKVYSGTEISLASTFLDFESGSGTTEQDFTLCREGISIVLSKHIPPAALTTGSWLVDTEVGDGKVFAGKDTAGTYSFVSGPAGCQDTFLFHISIDTFRPNLFEDTYQTCFSKPGTLYRPPNANDITWPDNISSGAYQMTEEGDFMIAYTLDGCRYQENISIYHLPDDTFRLDTTFCAIEGLTIDLSPYSMDYFFTWPDQGTSPIRTISSAFSGAVQLSPMDSTVCPATINISASDDGLCKDCNLYIPNAVSPNGDNINDVWSVYSDCITDIDLKIFNRWGGLVYTQTGEAASWDPQNQLEGVYIYQMRYLDPSQGRSGFKTGTLTVVR